MTDAALPRPAGVDYTTDAARARLKARYRAEARFRIYGMGAIALAALFIAFVLVDILLKGLPAFTQHWLVVDVQIDGEAIDPQNTRDPAVIAAADYAVLARDGLRAAFPDVKDRVGRRQLDRILSSSAGDTIRTKVLADPGVIGQKVPMRLLLSSDADLYFKGAGTQTARQNARGTAVPSGTTGDVTITLTGADLPSQLPSRLARGATVPLFDDKHPSILLALNQGLVKLSAIDGGALSGQVLVPLQSAQPAAAGAWQLIVYETPESNRRLSDRVVTWLEQLRTRGAVERTFNWAFFTSGDSREPELAGIRGALVGSALTLLVTLVICLPLGVAAAIYLEEFAPKTRLTEIIEVNINNLAAVPSIVFGLLGLAVFLNYFGLPRSAPLVGGLVLALLVLPTIIIASRAALKAVPPSIKEAALGVGASHQQAIFHHVLPLAMPGIMTGTIIGMAHALGETAPLLMIGMVAFIVEAPQGITDAATVLPVQIYLWSDLPEIGFQAKTAAAIIVLLVFLFAMNGIAIVLRKRFERRW